MKPTKKLGRGLEDFSHLFISSPSDSPKNLPENPQDSVSKEREVETPPRSICFLSHRALDERSFLVINLAREMARSGRKVLVLDGDFSIPRLTMLMQDAAATPLSHFITRNGNAGGEVHEKSGIRLISLDVDLSTLSALGQDDRARLMESFKLLEEESDLILAVASPDFIPHLKTLLHAVDEAIVITPHPIAEMINAYGLIKLIFQMTKNIRVGIVSSSVTDVQQAGMIFEKMKRIVEKFLDKPLYDYGFISDIGGEVHALHKHTVSAGESSSKAITCVTEISRTLIESTPDTMCSSASETNPRGFAEKLFTSTQGYQCNEQKL